MAEQHVGEALGIAVLDLLEGVVRRARPKAARALEWLRTAATPPPRVVLQASDGTLYTGFVIVDRNQPVLMLAVRHDGGPRDRDPPLITPPPASSPHQQSYEHDHRWREGDDVPFWRR